MNSFPIAHKYRSALADYPKDSVPSQPSVIAVVPVYNEIAHIGLVADDLLGQDYPGLREIWFMDGLSNDGTFEALQKLQSCDIRVRVQANPQRNQAAAINIVFSQAQSDIVIRLDGHARYATDMIRRSVEALLTTDAGGVGAIARPTAAQSVTARAIVAAHKSRCGVGVARFRQESSGSWVDTVWNGCYWRHVVRQVGQLREDLWRTEDNDFNERVRALGYGLYLSPAIKAYYYPRQSLLALWHQYMSNGIGVILALAENPRAFGIRHLAPLMLVLAFILPLLLALVWLPALLIVALLAAMYVGALLICALSTAKRDPGLHLVLLPAALATLHFSYGFGSLWGIILLARRVLTGNLSKKHSAN